MSHSFTCTPLSWSLSRMVDLGVGEGVRDREGELVKEAEREGAAEPEAAKLPVGVLCEEGEELLIPLLEEEAELFQLQLGEAVTMPLLLAPAEPDTEAQTEADTDQLPEEEAQPVGAADHEAEWLEDRLGLLLH